MAFLYVATVLGARGGPIVAASDWMKTIPQLVAPWIDAPFVALGTDGYGRSDFRKVLRSFFEVDRYHVVLATLRALGDDEAAKKAIEKYGIETEREAPWRR